MRALTGLLMVALGAGCAATTPSYTRTLSARASACLARAPQVYAPAAGGVAETPDNAKVRAAFEAALEPQARVRLRHDPALDLVAESLSENFSDQFQSASASLTQWLFWRSGSVATYHSHSGGWVRWARGTGSQPGDSLEQWARQAAERVNTSENGVLSYGLARFSAGRVTAEMIVFGRTHFEVEPFPKTYAPGGPLTIALRPRLPHSELRLLIDLGDAVEEQVLTPRPDGSFFASRSVPAKPGRYFIEIQGPGPQHKTLMMVPIYVGVPEPTAPDDFIQHPPPGPLDPTGFPQWIAARYDAERAKLGKPPITVDPSLSALAAGRATQLAAGRRVEPSDSKAFLAQLATAGFWPRSFTETITKADATDAVLMNLLRPSTRRRLLHRDAVWLGAGVAQHPAKADEPPRVTIVEETAQPTAAAAAAFPP